MGEYEGRQGIFPSNYINDSFARVPGAAPSSPAAVTSGSGEAGDKAEATAEEAGGGEAEEEDEEDGAHAATTAAGEEGAAPGGGEDLDEESTQTAM